MRADRNRRGLRQGWLCLLCVEVLCGCLPAPEFVNQEGRLLTTPPTITTTVNWNTAAADTIMANVQIFPTNNAWNEDISGLPVSSSSASIITTMGSATSIGYNSDMPFVIVPASQALVNITYGAYPAESDPGPYRLPLTAPIEGGSSSTGDRHVFSIDPINGYLYELYRGFPQSTSWLCDASCKWNLNSNATRTAGWTSCDASGMSVMAGVARFDECERGMVEHAIRVTFDRTRTSYVYPATHQAGGSSNTSWPRMGERFRLKASKDISSFPKHAKAIALAMKKYGLIVADNGSPWRISNVPDARFSGLSSLTTLKGSDFEVVVGTGATGGPRAPGAGNTCVHAGFAQTITLPASATLNGTANDPDTTTLIYAWSKVSGPGTVTFGNATLVDTTASFSVAGSYVLQLSAREGTNPAATASVTITVNPGAGNQAPVIGSAAAASPNPVNGVSSTTVTVTATDPDSGPSALVYTWSKVSGPGTVSFSPNGTTGSATSTATFSASGTYSLQVSVSDGAASVTSTITGLVVTLPTAPAITTQPSNVTVTAGATATFTVVASGTAPLTYQWQKNGTNIGGATGASYTTPATVTGDSGSTYRVIVTNGVGSVTSNSATLTVNAAAVAPAISTQPANVTVTAGATATFTVVASGTAPLTYQWQKNGTNIGGATSASYTTPATVTGDSGSTYRVIVTNGAGSATSNSATLTVNAAPVAPSITTQPTNKTVTAGATATFTVVASGTAPLTYQWQKNGTNIGGATGASYTTPATTTGDSGSTYRVIVTNSAGSATSNSATLTVNPAPNTITASVGTVNFSAPTGSTALVTTTLTLTNSSGSAITVTPSTGSTWLNVGGAVTVPAGGSATLTLTANPTGLSGTVTGSLTLTNSPGGQSQTLPVSLTVGGGTAGANKGKGCAVGAGGDAAWIWLLLALGLAGMCVQRRR